MAYIGFNPSQLAIAPFATKYFTGDGSTTTFTLDQAVPGANEANVEVFVENVQQNPIDAYTIGGALNNQLIFSEAPVSGAYIYVIHKGEATYNLQPSTGSVTAATLDPVLRNFTVDKFTGTGAQTAFTLSDTPYSVNSILVTVDGIVQQAGTNYTVSGTTLTFVGEAPDLGSDITVVHLGFSSGNKAVMDASITPVKLSTGGPTWTTTGSVGIGASPSGFGSGWNAYQTGGIALWSSPGNTNGYLTANMYYDGTNYRYINNGYATRLQLNLAGGLTLSVAPSGTAGSTLTYTELFRTDANGFFSIGTTNTNYISGNTLAKNLTVSGDGTSGVADGRLILANPIPYANISIGSTTAGRIYFIAPNTSTGTNGNAANISALLEGSGGANGYGTRLRFSPKADNGSDIVAMSLTSAGVMDLPYGQIKFPATQNASGDANTLDDYEEGSFSPTVNLLGTITYAQQNGRYVKIGRFVTVSIYMVYSSTDSTQDANVMYVQNLPYAVSANGQGSVCMLTERMYGVHSPSAVNTFHVQPSASSSSLLLLQNNWNAGITNATYFVSQQRSCYKGGSQYLIFTLTYEAIS